MWSDRGEREREREREASFHFVCHSSCEIFSIFQFLFVFLFEQLPFLSLCRQIKIVSFLVSLNRRGKKHNREEGEKEEDKEEEDKEEEER